MSTQHQGLPFEARAVELVFLSDIITPNVIGWSVVIGVICYVLFCVYRKVEIVVDRVSTLLVRAETVSAATFHRVEATSVAVLRTVESAKGATIDFVVTALLGCACVAVARALITRLMKERKESGGIKMKILSVGDAVIALTGAGIFAARGVQAIPTIVQAANFVSNKIVVALSGMTLLSKLYLHDAKPVQAEFVKEVKDVCKELSDSTSDEDEFMKPRMNCYGKCRLGKCDCGRPDFDEPRALDDALKDADVKETVSDLKVVLRNHQGTITFCIVVLAIVIYAVYRYCGRDRKGKPSPTLLHSVGCGCDDCKKLVAAPEKEAAQRLELLGVKPVEEEVKQSDDRRLLRERTDDRYHEKDVDQSRGWDKRTEEQRWKHFYAEELAEYARGDINISSKELKKIERLTGEKYDPIDRIALPKGGKAELKNVTAFGLGNSEHEKFFSSPDTYVNKQSAKAPLSSSSTVAPSSALNLKVANCVPEVKDKGELEKLARKRRVRKGFTKKFKEGIASPKEAGSFLISGLENRGGVCQVGTKWSNYVFAENHFILPLHAFTDSEEVSIYVPSGVVYVYKKSEGKVFSGDGIAFKFRAKTGEMAPPSLYLAVPDIKMPEVMVVAYTKFEDFAKRQYRITMGKLIRIDLAKSKEMAYYTAETDFGMSGAMALNEHQKCVGFHNQKGGLIPVTVELLQMLRGSKN